MAGRSQTPNVKQLVLDGKGLNMGFSCGVKQQRMPTVYGFLQLKGKKAHITIEVKKHAASADDRTARCAAQPC